MLLVCRSGELGLDGALNWTTTGWSLAQLRAVAGDVPITVETPNPGPAGVANLHAPHGIDALTLNMTLADLIDELERPDDSSSRSLYSNLQVA